MGQTHSFPKQSHSAIRLKMDTLTSRNLKTADISGEVKHHVNVKRQTRICTTWPSFHIA